MGKVFGKLPGVWQLWHSVRGQATAQNAPQYILYEPPMQVSLRILPLDKPHLLVPAVPADEDLDGVLGDGRGSWGLCLTHL